MNLRSGDPWQPMKSKRPVRTEAYQHVLTTPIQKPICGLPPRSIRGKRKLNSTIGKNKRKTITSVASLNTVEQPLTPPPSFSSPESVREPVNCTGELENTLHSLSKSESNCLEDGQALAKRKPLSNKPKLAYDLWQPRHIVRNYTMFSELDVCMSVYMNAITMAIEGEEDEKLKETLHVHKRLTRKRLMKGILEGYLVNQL